MKGGLRGAGERKSVGSGGREDLEGKRSLWVAFWLEEDRLSLQAGVALKYERPEEKKRRGFTYGEEANSFQTPSGSHRGGGYLEEI